MEGRIVGSKTLGYYDAEKSEFTKSPAKLDKKNDWTRKMTPVIAMKKASALAPHQKTHQSLTTRREKVRRMRNNKGRNQKARRETTATRNKRRDLTARREKAGRKTMAVRHKRRNQAAAKRNHKAKWEKARRKTMTVRNKRRNQAAAGGRQRG